MKVFSIFRRFLFAISEKCCNFASVIELQRHIEILLLTNDCVIVPDFGGFITHNVPARYDTSDKSFLPRSCDHESVCGIVNRFQLLSPR